VAFWTSHLWIGKPACHKDNELMAISDGFLTETHFNKFQIALFSEAAGARLKDGARRALAPLVD